MGFYCHFEHVTHLPPPEERRQRRFDVEEEGIKCRWCYYLSSREVEGKSASFAVCSAPTERRPQTSNSENTTGCAVHLSSKREIRLGRSCKYSGCLAQRVCAHTRKAKTQLFFSSFQNSLRVSAARGLSVTLEANEGRFFPTATKGWTHRGGRAAEVTCHESFSRGRQERSASYVSCQQREKGADRQATDARIHEAGKKRHRPPLPLPLCLFSLFPLRYIVFLTPHLPYPPSLLQAVAGFIYALSLYLHLSKRLSQRLPAPLLPAERRQANTARLCLFLRGGPTLPALPHIRWSTLATLAYCIYPTAIGCM